MGRAARLGWILLGLIAVFGITHAPLHGDGGSCSPAGLCSGLLALLVCAVVALSLGPVAVASEWRRLEVLRALHPVFLVERGRAPPRG